MQPLVGWSSLENGYLNTDHWALFKTPVGWLVDYTHNTGGYHNSWTGKPFFSNQVAEWPMTLVIAPLVGYKHGFRGYIPTYGGYDHSCINPNCTPRPNHQRFDDHLEGHSIFRYPKPIVDIQEISIMVGCIHHYMPHIYIYIYMYTYIYIFIYYTIYIYAHYIIILGSWFTMALFFPVSKANGQTSQKTWVLGEKNHPFWNGKTTYKNGDHWGMVNMTLF